MSVLQKSDYVQPSNQSILNWVHLFDPNVVSVTPGNVYQFYELRFGPLGLSVRPLQAISNTGNHIQLVFGKVDHGPIQSEYYIISKARYAAENEIILASTGKLAVRIQQAVALAKKEEIEKDPVLRVLHIPSHGEFALWITNTNNNNKEYFILLNGNDDNKVYNDETFVTWLNNEKNMLAAWPAHK